MNNVERHFFNGTDVTKPCLDCYRPYETKDERHDFGKVFELVETVDTPGGPAIRRAVRPYVMADYEREVAAQGRVVQMGLVAAAAPDYRHRISVDGNPESGYTAAIVHFPPNGGAWQAFGEAMTSIGAIKDALSKTRADSPFESERTERG